MKNIAYVVALVGVIGLGLGVYWDFIKADHHTRGLVSLIAGVVLLIVGIVMLFMKPKAQAA